MTFWRTTLAVSAFAIAHSTIGNAAAQLHYTRYLGFIETDGADRKIALTMDLFVVQPNDPSSFPRPGAVLKLGLGGPQSHEYVSQLYESIRYDFDNQVLSIDAPDSELAITATVAGTDQTIIDGQALIRSSGTIGHLHLEEVSDDPDVPTGGGVPVSEYKVELTGQYEGLCGNRESILQIESARGLSGAPSIERYGLSPYAIVGRLGMHDAAASCPAPLFCAMRNYTKGTFDYFLNRLVLEAGTTDECTITSVGANCMVHLGADDYQCQLKRRPTPIAKPEFFSRRFHVGATPAQRTKLPEPDPPANNALVAGLRGTFTGYLHHEGNDRYQPMRMSVIAASSTDNPHNENLVYVTGTTTLHFGRILSPDFWVQQFEPRSFYLTTGFTLESPGADAFLQIAEWKQGYIRGVFLSHAFGRVGTFELVKGTELPSIDSEAVFVPSLVGTYQGPHGLGGDADDAWRFQLQVPPQSPEAGSSTLAFKGSYQLSDGALPRRSIASGSYDFYAGAMSWITGDGRVITGRVPGAGALELFWPGAPIWDVLLESDHAPYPYRRL